MASPRFDIGNPDSGTCKYPPAEPEALCFEPLKAASGAFVAHANFPFGSCAYERMCPTFGSLSLDSAVEEVEKQ